MASSNHAIVILAHKDPDSVSKLIDILGTEFDVFIHWDGKFEYPEELIGKAFPIYPRIPTLWAEFSLWEAMWVSLYELNYGKYYDVTFISANDFPCMKPKEMIKLLESTNKSFLNLNDTYSSKEFGDRLIPYGMRVGHGKIEGTEELMAQYLPNKYDEFDVGFKFSRAVGSQWCTIKMDVMPKLVEYLKSHPDFIKALRNSLIVDEMAFQNLFTELNLPFEDYHRKLDFVDDKGHPKLITEDEVIELIKSNSDIMFCRKVDLSTFKKLDEIKKMLI